MTDDASKVLGRLLSSEVKGDLLVLFHKNPGLIDSYDGIARRIGRTSKEIETEVADLLDLGILKRKAIGKSEVIFLDHSKDREVQGTIANYITSLKR